MTDNQIIKKLLEALFDEREIRNQSDFAQKTGIGGSLISQIMSGKKSITAETVEKITQTYPNVNKSFLKGKSDKVFTNVNNKSENMVNESSPMYGNNEVKMVPEYIIELIQKAKDETIQAKNETINILMNNLLKPAPEKPIEESPAAKEFIEKNRGKAICITDENSNLLFVNDVFEEQTGYPGDYAKGRKPGDFLRGEEDEIKKEMREAIKRNQPFEGEITNTTKDGRKVVCKLQFKPFNYNNQTYFISAAKFENVPEQILVRKSEN